MKIVIDIPKRYKTLLDNGDANGSVRESILLAVTNGTPQLKFGWWIKEESIYGWDGYSYQCSACGRSIHLDTDVEDLEDYPYCHCGAKMREVEE